VPTSQPSSTGKSSGASSGSACCRPSSRFSGLTLGWCQRPSETAYRTQLARKARALDTHSGRPSRHASLNDIPGGKPTDPGRGRQCRHNISRHSRSMSKTLKAVQRAFCVLFAEPSARRLGRWAGGAQDGQKPWQGAGVRTCSTILQRWREGGLKLRLKDARARSKSSLQTRFGPNVSVTRAVATASTVAPETSVAK
jgi:hypothetical protein